MFAGRQVSHWDFPRNTVSVALMAEFGCHNGLAVGDVLKDSGLSNADLRDPQRMIAGRQELTVAANLVDLLGDPANLGVQVGGGYHVGSLGIFGFACLTSSTLGDAVRFAARFYELSYGFCLPSVTVDGPEAALRLDLPDLSGPVADFLVRRDLAAIARVMAALLGDPVTFTSIEFTSPAPHSEYDAARDVFGVSPRYDAPLNAARFPAALLHSRLPQASEMTVAACTQQCQDVLERRRARTGVARQVRDRLASIDGENRTIAGVARHLAVSERTLRRRLAEESTSFRDLVDEVHRGLAEELLQTGALSVEDVAVRLGYAEATSFIAAFKRWTGNTPARYRRSSAPRGRRAV